MLENTFTVRHIIFTANVGMFQDEQTILNHKRRVTRATILFFIALYGSYDG